MKYKGEEIGIPCPEMVQEFIDECGLLISAEEVLEYWRGKNFLTKRGQPVKTLEAMVHSANSIFVQRSRKVGNNSKNDFKEFERLMRVIYKNDPESWSKLYSEAVRLVKEHDFSHTCELQ